MGDDDTARASPDADATTNPPVLSAVVIARDDEDRIERSLRAVVEQESPAPFEVIAVVSGTDRTADIVREKFPSVRLIVLPRPAFPGSARNAGLKASRGRYVTFPGSHIVLPQGSLAARVRTHEAGYPMVTGVVVNGTPTAAGWAAYFLDHSANLPSAPSSELSEAPIHCSYDREVLLTVAPFREDLRAVEDTAVNVALWNRGIRAYRSNQVTMIHHSPCTTVGRLLGHHRARGGAMGRVLIEQASAHPGVGSRSRALFWLIRYVPVQLARITRNIRRYGDPQARRRYRRALPLVFAALVASCYEAAAEVMRRDRKGPGGPAAKT